MIEIITHPLIVLASIVVSILIVALIIAEKQDNKQPPDSN